MRRAAVRVMVLGFVVAVLPVTGGVVAQDEGGVFPEDTVAVGLGSPSSVDVAVELSAATFADGGAEVVLIGRDDLFPDSLSSGVAQADGPLLLVPTDGPVPTNVAAEINRLGAARALVLGAEAAVSDAVVAELEGLGLAVQRLSGPTRIETAIDTARVVAPGATTALLARSEGVAGNPTSGFADTLAAGGWSAATGWPVLLTQTAELTATTRAYLESSAIETVVIVGGTAAVQEAVADAVRGLGIEVRRVAASERAGTAVAVAAERGAPTAATSDHVTVVDGFGDAAWAAGFAAAARSARLDAPIVLANVDTLPPATADWLVPGPDAITCATSPAVCDQARIAIGFDPVVPTDDLPAGTVLFTIADPQTSRVMAVAPDGSSVRLAHGCDQPTCAELDWDAASTAIVLKTMPTDRFNLTLLQGVPLTVVRSLVSVEAFSFDVSNLAGDDVFVAHIDTNPNFLRERLFGSGGGPSRSTAVPARVAGFQSINAMANLPHAPGNGTPHLYVGIDENLYVNYVMPGGGVGGGITDVPAHITRRPGAAIIGAALAVDGSGDIAITDVIGGQGVLRYATPDGDVVTAEGLDVSSTPYMLPDGETIVVLAQIDGTTALVRVTAATGDHEVLVEDAGVGQDDHRIGADGSGTFVAWSTGSDLRILDTRDGSVAIVTPPAGFAVTGGPAVKQ